MGHIKEPKGVDFVINGKPLTDKQKQAISKFISADKTRLEKRKTHFTKNLNRQQSASGSRV